MVALALAAGPPHDAPAPNHGRLRCAVRAARNPLIDPVRSPVEGIGDDDPLAGGLDEAPDALVVRIR